jgi:uncharacterized protein YgfB (UPF0149 family)
MSLGLYSTFEGALRQVGCTVVASEAYGALVGLLSGPRPVDQKLWLNCINDDLKSSTDSSISLQNTDLDVFIQRAVNALGDMEADALIIIPDDNVELGERIAAFSGWCSGFLYGFGISGIPEKVVMSADSQEFLRHLTQFCRLEFEVENSEEDEKALFELLEFSKVGVLNLNEEVKKFSSIDTETNSLH